MIIAIDGPAGAGKSTISQRLAERLGFTRLDTGALYRAVALAEMRKGNAADAPDVGPWNLEVEGDRLTLDGEDISQAIRAPEISSAASDFAKNPAVRAGLLALQRRLGRARDTILDGRDIGTVVFPDADVKIYLTAQPEARAHRRWLELEARGHAQPFRIVLAEIMARDKQDMGRAIAPLRRAEDAVEVDASELGIEEAVEACLAVVRQARG
ncbi:(d)CMP kinase [Myxococcota bacterium]|nr:(d)CMP kinase [Myxococcota bacterium]MBU1432390.1 (d)CMP kinase [Myxococcota bacterium]MBU1897052.1 (d)CMP kinase [Myxococcota bacterium]